MGYIYERFEFCIFKNQEITPVLGDYPLVYHSLYSIVMPLLKKLLIKL